MEEEIKAEKLNEFERLVYYILLKHNSDKAFRNEPTELITKEYLKEMIKFLKKEKLFENDLRRIN